MKQTSFLLFIFALSFQSAHGKRQASKTLSQFEHLNSKKAICEMNTPDPSEAIVYTDYLWKMGDQLGVSRESDWKWLSVVSQFDPMIENEMSVDMLRMNPKKSQVQMLDMVMGKCRLKINGHYTLNDTQDKIVVQDVSKIEILVPEACKVGSADCVVYNGGATYRIIAQNKSSPPLSESALTPEFLKPLRDKRVEINQRCH